MEMGAFGNDRNLMIRTKHVAQFVSRNRAAKSCAEDYLMCNPNLLDRTGAKPGFGTPTVPFDKTLPCSVVASSM